jgi:hypothetical protein
LAADDVCGGVGGIVGVEDFCGEFEGEEEFGFARFVNVFLM